MKKSVHTTIPQELWLQAQLKNISWSTALEKGIKLILNLTDDEEELKRKIQENETETLLLQKQLTDLKLKKQEIKLKEKKNVVKEWS